MRAFRTPPIVLLGQSHCYSHCARACALLWPFSGSPARLVTMVLVPAHLRLISTSCLSFVWNIALAMMLRQ